MCINEDDGDMILIDRLSKFVFDVGFSWGTRELVTLEDISLAITLGIDEEKMPFGDARKSSLIENKSKEWHIKRILYFINHPNEIKNIDIDNLCDEYKILPIPLIIDGNHRFFCCTMVTQERQT